MSKGGRYVKRGMMNMYRGDEYVQGVGACLKGSGYIQGMGMTYSMMHMMSRSRPPPKH